MEVKISDSMPLWFAKLLSKYEIYPTSFSKYGNFYKRQLKEEQKIINKPGEYTPFKKAVM